jgi:transposase
MPWQECNPMDERLKFVAGLLDGEKMAVLCRRFGVSRKTGYKILERYNSCGLEGLTDRSRRPYRHANQLPVQIETLIVRSKQERPHWGAPKIRERLARLYPDVHTPAISTVHAVLDRHGLVKRRCEATLIPQTRRYRSNCRSHKGPAVGWRSNPRRYRKGGVCWYQCWYYSIIKNKMFIHIYLQAFLNPS